jgi:hypothetical protein
MRKTSAIVGCLATGTIATALLATASILYLMFSTDERLANKKGLFGAVFFKSTENPSGSLQVGVGVENLATLGLVWLVVTAFITMCVFMIVQLKAYKNSLRTSV